MLDKILAQVNDQTVTACLQELIRIPSINPPGNELPVAQTIAQRLAVAGLETNVIDFGNNRGNVVARLRGKGTKPGLMYNGHLDVVPPGQVPWQYDPFAAEIIDGKIYGRGASDMKSGLAAMAVAVELIARSGVQLAGDLVLSGTAGEEVDGMGALKLVESQAFEGIGNIVVGEPSSLEVFVAHKGAIWLEFTTYGKTAHGSMPDLGINAILAMHRLIEELQKYSFNVPPHPLLNTPTMNIATIQGGIKTNVVPDLCKLTVDIRTIPGQDHEVIIADMQDLLDNLRDKFPGFRGELQVINNKLPVETPVDHSLVQRALAVGQRLLQKTMAPRGVNYYTDASVFVHETGIPTILFGPGDEKLAHQPNEHVAVSDLTAAVKFYIAFALDLLAE